MKNSTESVLSLVQIWADNRSATAIIRYELTSDAEYFVPLAMSPSMAGFITVFFDIADSECSHSTLQCQYFGRVFEILGDYFGLYMDFGLRLLWWAGLWMIRIWAGLMFYKLELVLDYMFFLHIVSIIKSVIINF